jgi:molybdopterin/thiamine biosynthesis adenylyltransferase
MEFIKELGFILHVCGFLIFILVLTNLQKYTCVPKFYKNQVIPRALLREFFKQNFKVKCESSDTKDIRL